MQKQSTENGLRHTITSRTAPSKEKVSSSPGSGSRLVYIDNLRVLMIVLVILVHTGVTYSGIGSWYYIENKSVDAVSTIFFAMFLSFTQAYFLSMLFMISGYFIPRALEKRGTRAFVSSKLFRLGIPSLIYIFALSPLTEKLANPDLELGQYYLNGLRSLDFIGWTGPLWFAIALLFFSIVYAAARLLSARYVPQFLWEITVLNVVLLVSLITLLAFGIRTVFPIGTDIANFQFSFFAAYIIMFAVGVMGYRQSLFDKIDDGIGKRWLIASFALGIPTWLAIIVFGGVLDGIYLFQGGLNWQAFTYAAWESFFCVTVIIGLMGVFKKHANTQISSQKLLSDNAFAVYAFHAPVLVGISMLLQGIALHPLAKWALIAILVVPVTFIVAHMLRKINVLRKVFS